MRKTKKVLGLLISVCMLISLVPTFVSAAGVGETFTSGLFNYTVNSDGNTVTLTSIAASALSGEVVIPSTVSDGTKNYTVTILGEAFKNKGSQTSGMTKLVMADTITEITATAPFYACKFTELHLSSGLTKHVQPGQLVGTFRQCNQLYTVNIPAGITKLNATFLEAGSIKNVILEGTAVRDLCMTAGADYQAFKNGSAINFYMPYTTTPASQFSRMGSGQITPSYLFYEGDYVFDLRTDGSGTVRMYSLLPGKTFGETVVIPETLGGKTVTQLYLYNYRNNQVTKNFTMPDTVTTIDSGTFYSWKALENVHLSAALTNGGAANQLSNTFQYCSKLTTVEIPAGITRCWGTFKNSAVRTVKITGTAQVDFFADVTSDTTARAWSDGVTGITISYPANGTIPKRYTSSFFTATAVKETVKFTYGDFTYEENGTGTVTLTAIAADKLVGEVVIPETVTDGTNTYTVTKLGEAFKNKGAQTAEMTKLVMADTITEIIPSAPFYDCKFTEVHLSSGLTKHIEQGQLVGTFNMCNQLYTVNIPTGITKLNATFLNAGSVRNVILEGTAVRDLCMTAGANYQAFADGKTINFYMPYTATPSSQFSRMGDGKITPSYLFYEGDYVFDLRTDGSGTVRMYSLLPGKTFGETVVIPETLGGKTVTQLYLYNYRNNQVTKNFTMPDTVTTIDSGTFYSWKALENVHLSAALTNGGAANQLSNTFQYCSKLTTVEIPAGITKCWGTFKNSAVKTVKIKGTSSVDFFAGVTGDVTARAWNDGETGITIYYPAGGAAPTRYSASGSFTATAIMETTTFTYGDFTYVTNGATTVTLTAIAANELVGEVIVPGTVSYEGKTYTVTKLGDAFKGTVDAVKPKTAGMTSLVLPDTITHFTGTATFYACAGLEFIHLPKNLVKDGGANLGNCLLNTFQYCNKLTSVTLPASINACPGTFKNSTVRTVIVTGTGAVAFYCDASDAKYRAWNDNTTGITIYYPENGTAPTRINANGINPTVVQKTVAEMPLYISALSADGDTVSLNLLNANTASVTGNLNIFCAFYSKDDDSLVDVGVANINSVSAYDVDTVTVDMSEDYDANSMILKAFVWEVGTLDPFADAKTLN